MKLIRSKCDSVRKAREAHLINKAKTLHPFGINRRDEARPLENLNHLQIRLDEMSVNPEFTDLVLFLIKNKMSVN